MNRRIVIWLTIVICLFIIISTVIAKPWLLPRLDQIDRVDRAFSVQLENVLPDLEFVQPLGFHTPPNDPTHFFIIEQYGTIYLVDKNNPTEKKVFLDLTGQVRTGHSEEGLLGFAFHPQYEKNGYFFVDYIADNPRHTVVSRFKRSEKNPDQADPKSEVMIITIEQPYGNHNGGQLAFGPDGDLYISLGDGGSAGDPHGYGQNKKVLLGKILRLDVDHPQKGKNYAIPPDNPFAGNREGFREEIFSYGMRNPWRFSFDLKTGKLWAGDVGQDKPNEEIDIIENGKNYGWNIMEGFDCYNPPTGCDKRGLTLPSWSYSKESGRSITGGFVYRGKAIPELYGLYVYGDFVSGRVWALKYENSHPQNHLLLHNPNLYPSSFGVDPDGEIYICSFDGRIYKLVKK